MKRKQKRFVYLVGKRTDQRNTDNLDIILTYDVKDTYDEAKALADRNPGLEVYKRRVI